MKPPKFVVDLIPKKIRHWDWDKASDCNVNSLLTRGEVMEICLNYIGPLFDTAFKEDPKDVRPLARQSERISNLMAKLK